MSGPAGFRSLGIAIWITVSLGLLANTASSAVSSVALYQTGSWSDFQFFGGLTTLSYEHLMKTVTTFTVKNFPTKFRLNFSNLRRF